TGIRLMGNIRILPESVVSKIAAGEIVERPSSIVKELVENALDAGSTRINIELGAGGKRLIRVSDNGVGMSRDDALLSLERHATSKLKTIDDLLSINTLGFRGEALPSIAGVSRFSITTRTEGDIAGIKIAVMGGTIKSVQETGCPQGTSVEARDIFYNTPPRLKFMKTSDTELRNVLDVVQRESLSRPDVRFELSHDGKDIILLPEKGSIEHRLPDIFPETDLYRVYIEVEGILIHGFMNGPDDARSTTQKLYAYVNSRTVKDRFLTRMAIDSYGTLLDKGKFPQGMLSIDLPYQEVDVNVHPTKNEVRFRKPKLIGDLIKTAILEMLRGAPWIRGYHDRIENAVTGFYEKKQHFETRVLDRDRTALYYRKGEDQVEHGDRSKLESDNITFYKRAGAHPLKPLTQGALRNEGYFSSLKILGQIGELYIVCESEEGMILIDQHAAHERLNYEKLKRAHSGNVRQERQELLLPITLELSPYETRMMKENLEELNNLGIELEEFGKDGFVIRSIASMLVGTDIKGLIKDILGEISSLDKEMSLTERRDNIIATIACHSSIRASDKLNHQKIIALLGQLDKAEFPHSCPHGRPVVRGISFEELDRMFKRT
ncbi:MAG: DNA mismatch repair endonuclease MutL, partial [Deltaproteobacteria bacterium]|nr:DNA mismatch repair endonuclease MutL [Deltaproteobacteria bacterium]